MRKNFLQDVKPPSQKRSIRDIPLPGGRKISDELHKDLSAPVVRGGDVKIHPTPSSSGIKRPINREPEIEKPIAPPPSEIDRGGYNNDYRKPSRKFPKKLWFILGLIVLLLAIFVSRPRAEVIIEPKTENIYVSESFNIHDKNLSSAENSIGYKSLPIEKTVSTVVKASGEESVEQKASGKIKIINTDSDQVQPLVKNTRFQTDSGLIYRINESIEVPGTSNGNPGIIEVEVFADSVGEEYNIGKTKFTIPGFKGLAQFESITAESVTDMTGGFDGVRKVVSEEDRNSAIETLKSQARTEIINEISNIENEAILVYGESDIFYSSPKQSQDKNDVELSLTATLNVYLFESDDLAEFIVNKKLSGANGNSIDLVNPEEIKFEIQKNTNEEGESFTLLFIEGELKLEWEVDEGEIKSLLENKKRGELVDILGNKENIEEVSATISPVWKNKFPKESKIKVIVNYLD